MNSLKTLFITGLVLALGNNLNAQAVTKKILVEHFTNTKCGICASRNPGFYTALAQNPDVLHIAYHPSSPYTTCLFSTQNKAENDARTNYYGLFGGTPTFTINGLEKSSSEVQSSGIYNPFKNQTSPLSIKMNLLPAGSDSIGVTVVITSVAEHSLTNLTLYVALAEDSVFYNAPNGEKVHYDVFRKSFTGNNPIGFTAPKDIGKTYTYNSKVAKRSIWKINRLSALVIISDKVDNVIQSHQSDLYNETTSSINNINESENSASVYPNPAANIIHIKWEGKSNKADLLILNQFGKSVMNIKNINQEHVLDISELKSGLYYFHIFENSHASIIKLIKL